MRTWLSARKVRIEVVPNPDDPASVLRPSRATTVGEKQEMKKRKAQCKATGEKERKINKDLTDLQEAAAAEGQALKATMDAAKREQPASLQSTMFDSSRQLGDQRRTPARGASGPITGGTFSIASQSENQASLNNLLSPGHFAPVAAGGLHETPIEEDTHVNGGSLRTSGTPMAPFWENNPRSSPGTGPGNKTGQQSGLTMVNSNRFMDWGTSPSPWSVHTAHHVNSHNPFASPGPTPAGLR